MGKHWKTMGKSWDNHGKTIANTYGYPKSGWFRARKDGTHNESQGSLRWLTSNVLTSMQSDDVRRTEPSKMSSESISKSKFTYNITHLCITICYMYTFIPTYIRPPSIALYRIALSKNHGNILPGKCMFRKIPCAK